MTSRSGWCCRRSTSSSSATCCRKQFRLVGNGRGDVAHEDFRVRVRESLDEFGSDLDLSRFDEFAEHVLFAGGGFVKADPGSLLDVIGEAEREVGEKPALIHYLAVPPSAFAPDDRGDRRARSGREREGGLREAVRHLHRELPRAGRAGAQHLRRGAGLPDRPLPREGGDPEPAPGAVRQPALRRRLERRAPGPGPDRRAGDAGHRRPGRVLRRHRGGARHAGHPPVPGGGRGGDGAAAEHGGRRPAGRPRGGDRGLPAAGPVRGGARAVRDLPADRGHRARLDHRHLRRGAAVDRHRPLAGRAVRAADRARRWRPAPSGSA